MKVDSFLKWKIERKLQKMESQLSPEDYREFQKRMKQLEMEFDTELNTLQYKINDIALDTEEEYRELIEGYIHIFDGMEEDIKEYEHILWDEKELSEDELIAKVKEFSYAALFLDEDTYENGNIKQLVKWVVDTMVIENVELAKQVFDTKGAILVDMMKTIFSWDGIKQIAKGLWESIWGLFSGDVYKTGRSIWELGLITTGAGVIGVGLKKWAKIAMKQIGKKAKKWGKKDIETKGVIWNGLQTTAKAMIETVKKGKAVAVALVKKWAEKIKDWYGKLKDEVRQLNEPIMVTNEWIAMPVNMKSQMDGDNVIKKETREKKTAKKELGKEAYQQKLEEDFKKAQEAKEKTANIKEEHLVEHFDISVDIDKYDPKFENRDLIFPDQMAKLEKHQIQELKDNIAKMLKNEDFPNEIEKLKAVSILLLRNIHRRSPDTWLHSSRMASYIDLFGANLELTKKQITELKIAALIHDVGKLETPNYVLNKAGKINNKEFDIMKWHVSWSEDFLKDILDVGKHEWILKWAYQHHEKVGGWGYPHKLSWEQIHPNAKIMAIVDVFEAMTGRRVYKQPISLEKTKKALKAWTKEYTKGERTILQEFDPIITKNILNIIENTDINELKNINPNLLTQKEIDTIKLVQVNK